MTGDFGRSPKLESKRRNALLIMLPMCCAIVILFQAMPPAHADTLYLKSGGILATKVERFSDGAFWVKDGKKTVIVKPEEILKIVFSPETETTVTVKPGKAKPRRVDHEVSGPAILSIPPAAASFPSMPPDETKSPADAADDSPGRPDLAILNYHAIMNSGIFQIVGEVENRTPTAARYVKITVILMDGSGEALDQNFSYVHPDPPHLRPTEKKHFRVSFINPPPGTTKYKIRVESSQF